MITRFEYVATPRGNKEEDEKLHRSYYAQFVTDEVKEAVETGFGIDLLVDGYTKGRSLNSIPLRFWDALVDMNKDAVNHERLKEAGDGWSLASGLCIFKEAARQVVESRTN